MGDKILDYASVPQPLTRRERVAAAANRMAWLLWGITFIGCAVLMPVLPGGHMMLGRDWSVAVATVVSVCLLAGGVIALAGVILGNRWRWFTLFVYLVAFVAFWPVIIPLTRTGPK